MKVVFLFSRHYLAFFTGLSHHCRMIIQIVDLAVVYHPNAEEKRELFSKGKPGSDSVLNLVARNQLCLWSEPLTLTSEKGVPN